MLIDRGSREVENRVESLVVCGDAIVTVRGEVRRGVEVVEAGTLKLYGHVAGDVEVNTAGRVDIHGVVDGDLRVTAGDVRVIGSVGSVSGDHASAVKLCSGCIVGDERIF